MRWPRPPEQPHVGCRALSGALRRGWLARPARAPPPQWPVFPWVLSDYRSPELDLSGAAAFRDLARPIGALNPARLAMLRARYADMRDMGAEPPFLYGTHYSCPGYTMYW